MTPRHGRLRERTWATSGLPPAADVLGALVYPGALGGAAALDGLDAAWGWPFGETDVDAVPRPRPAGGWPHPRTLLETLLRDALVAGPVVITFSGGRDSSALLALALHVARRDGVPEPIALTYRYPDADAGAQESQWQDLVARHVGLTTWERCLVGDELDLLGPLGGSLLALAGRAAFPYSLAAEGYACGVAQGGTLVTGEIGDWAFAPRRMTVLRAMARGHGWRRASTRAYLVEVAGPRSLRRQVMARGLDELPWLQPAAAAERRRQAATAPLPPLRWDRDLLTLDRQRFFALGAQTHHAMADAFGCARLDPFADADFLAALAAWGGAVGIAGRNPAMRALFSDLLPPELLVRTTKAHFNGSRVGPPSRAFAADWDGSGVDRQLVDVEALRAEWLKETPHAGSLSLLQHAWLASR